MHDDETKHRAKSVTVFDLGYSVLSHRGRACRLVRLFATHAVTRTPHTHTHTHKDDFPRRRILGIALATHQVAQRALEDEREQHALLQRSWEPHRRTLVQGVWCVRDAIDRATRRANLWVNIRCISSTIRAVRMRAWCAMRARRANRWRSFRARTQVSPTARRRLTFKNSPMRPRRRRL